MKRKIINTADGSKTIQLIGLDEQYHSIHGALQESQHVFVNQGLLHFYSLNKSVKPITILEIGFGTGLNAMTTLAEITNSNLQVSFVGIEAYPVSEDEILELNYGTQFTFEGSKQFFKIIHKNTWEKQHVITSAFTLTKQKKYFSEISDINMFDIIYFDAFAPRIQPEHWTEDMFKIMYNALKNKGILVTYSAKGSVRRAMQTVGFNVEKIQGPPGKREMLRGTKYSASKQS
ncbi:tRNA (5-methylaminomethyl-2-thiouridine)(34)-methyltransferase MnmD [Formosa maritima]|uniref:tRNA (5-methylaminomethyl-2-thiouridine)(34)-methyltransferase MnmD n=1 Tax=Formosa maritima TaxID=2592046 RepID=A0A5D0GJ58_9FLAO|nr:tRNA (5-methylaminomethyl-2-thiouridine)(34)-methyltransferase MnmD [Formosa maritima]TYA57532.1 tRNA (5-methylaminomethyl-2-thiouridine)(34)-methyltransferase MnmD [Formosa maritima]